MGFFGAMTEAEKERLIIAECKRQKACVCFALMRIPLIPLRGQRLKVPPVHPECPIHGNQPQEKTLHG